MHFLTKPNVDRLHNRFVHGHIGRREFMAASMAAGLAPVMTTGSSGARAEDGKMITHLTWSGYELPELFGPFVEAHGDAAALIEDTTFPVNTDPEMDQLILNLWEEIRAGM